MVEGDPTPILGGPRQNGHLKNVESVSCPLPTAPLPFFFLPQKWLCAARGGSLLGVRLPGTGIKFTVVVGFTRTDDDRYDHWQGSRPLRLLHTILHTVDLRVVLCVLRTAYCVLRLFCTAY